jgi:putative restriction endonuclease
MAFWWVNHKQTVRQDTEGGYVWSPKANANGARNASYDNLTRCQPGDVVYSYAYGRIGSIGLVETAAITAPKPPEFGSAGDYWSQEGWLVRVNWQPLREPLVPQTFFALLQPLLPERHSPISTISGRGNQGVYLAALDEALGLLLLKLIEDHADPAVHVHLVVLSDEGSANGQGESIEEAKADLQAAIELLLEDREADINRGLPPEALRLPLQIG